MIVLDTSVFFDYFIRIKGKENRNKIAREIIDLISAKDFILFEPFILEIELLAILSRYFSKETAKEITENILEKVILLEEKDLYNVSKDIALKTGCRAIDSYFIATAKITGSILISSDKKQIENAKKAGKRLIT